MPTSSHPTSSLLDLHPMWAEQAARLRASKDATADEIDDRIADVEAQTLAGVLVQLRLANAHLGYGDNHPLDDMPVGERALHRALTALEKLVARSS